MDMYGRNRNYTSYRYWQDGLFTPPNSGRCPYCRHKLPECDCGYGLILLESKKGCQVRAEKNFQCLEPGR